MVKTHTDKEIVDLLETIYRCHIYACKTAADGPHLKNEFLNSSKKCTDAIVELQQDFLDRCGLL